MTRPLDTLLRTTVLDLADEARPGADFVDVALARGKRLRRRRQTTGALATVVTLAALTAAPLIIDRRPVEPAPATTVALSAAEPMATTVWRDDPVQLPGGWVITGAETQVSKHGVIALERSRGSYVTPDLHGGQVVPAPRGDYAILSNASWTDRDPGPRLGLWNVHDGTVRWVHNVPPLSRPSWSPDGTTVVFDAPADDRTAGFAVLDLTENTLTRHPVDGAKFRCMETDCTYVWEPGGTEVALSTIAPTGSAGFGHLQLFSARTGEPTRTLPVNGAISSDRAWSPDGSQILVDGVDGTEVVDVASGVTVTSIPEQRAFFVAKDRILGVGADAVLRDMTGKELQRTSLPDGLGSDAVIFAAPPD
jgi:hypothetical protein